MSRTIGVVAGESDIAKGIPTETLGETHGLRHANASVHSGASSGDKKRAKIRNSRSATSDTAQNIE